jgi:hypothetical protein
MPAYSLVSKEERLRMPNAAVKLIVLIVATGMVSACVGFGPEASRAEDSQNAHENAFREMKQRQFADPQVPGWVNVNPQSVLFTADP